MDVRAAIASIAGVGCLALLGAGVAILRDEPAATVVRPTPTPTSPAPDRVVTQPRWVPADLADAPVSPLALRLRPAAGAPTVRKDPMPGVVVAWARKGAGPLLLGTDDRWRAAPRSMATNQFSDYPADPPAITSDGTRVAAATTSGLRVLDVTTGHITTVAWPKPLEPPWDWAPALRWLPGEQSLLVLHWTRPWVVGLDGAAERAHYPIDQVSDVFGIDPAGPVHQNDWPRRTLVTWEGDEAVHDAPFVQCERLVAAHGLVACTAGSLRSSESGPVVVDAASGEIVGYAPVRDPSAFHSDNAHLTAMGFTDPETLLLQVGTRDGAWYLVTWSFGDGRFEVVARTGRDLRHLAVAPALLD